MFSGAGKIGYGMVIRDSAGAFMAARNGVFNSLLDPRLKLSPAAKPFLG